jgi:hypothetical protein
MKFLFLTFVLSLSFHAFSQKVFVSGPGNFNTDLDRSGSHGEFKVPKEMCVTRISETACKHTEKLEYFAPYSTTALMTRCSFQFEIYNESSSSYVVHDVTGYHERAILVSDNVITFVANILTINAIEATTVQAAKGLNKKDIKSKLNKIMRVLESRKCE